MRHVNDIFLCLLFAAKLSIILAEGEYRFKPTEAIYIIAYLVKKVNRQSNSAEGSKKGMPHTEFVCSYNKNSKENSMSPITLLSAEQRIAAMFPQNTGLPIEHITQAAKQFVRKMCIRSHLRGYSYLITAIVLGKKEPYLLSSLTSLLYPSVAAIYSTTPAAVERSIRSAIESAARLSPEQMQSVFYYHTKKPYISEVLALAMETIQPELYTDISLDLSPSQSC